MEIKKNRKPSSKGDFREDFGCNIKENYQRNLKLFYRIIKTIRKE